VAAVLRPHHREDPELGEVRLAPEKADDPFVLVGLEAVAFERLLVHGHAVANAFTIDSRMTSPSTLPSRGSQARSGCGIMPTTLRRSLQMPAFAWTDPFGFAASSRRPSGVV